MDDVLAGKLDNINERSTEELAALKEELKTEFQGIDTDNLTPETVERMEALNEAMSTLKSEETRREAEAKELAARAEDASQVFNSETEESDDVDSEEVADENVAAVESTEDVAEEETPVEEVADDAADVAEDAEAVAEDVAEVADEEEAPAEAEAEVEAEDVVVDEAEDDSEEKVNTNFASESDTESDNNESEDESEDDTNKELSAEVNSEAELADKNETEDESEDDASELSVETPTESEEVTVNTEFSAPDQNAPAVNEVEAVQVKTPVIIAAADVRGVQSGSVIPTPRALSQAILDRRKAMDRTYGGDGEQALVASIVTDSWYGEEKTLASGDTEGNRAKVEAVVASLKGADIESLTAAGGLYGPVDTSWDIYELGETLGRPVKDSLPSFKADRGGLRFMTPPTLADLEGAVSVWTMQDDLEAAEDSSDKEKPCIRINAGTEVTVYLEAQPLCLTFGNIGARAYPELVERHISLAMVYQARFAESRLLNRIGALSTKVTAAKKLGAARDILVQVDKAAARIRNKHRLDPEAPLRAIFPEWFKNALRADLVMQLPGDGQEAAFDLQDSTIDRLFASRNVSVTWSLDGEDSSQYFATQADGSALVDFPSTVVWYLFPEGTFLFLEEANLDLGIVRDSTLNATNDYKMFVETFENVAKVGVESLKVTSQVAIAGASAGTVNTLA